MQSVTDAEDSALLGHDAARRIITFLHRHYKSGGSMAVHARFHRALPARADAAHVWSAGASARPGRLLLCQSRWLLHLAPTANGTLDPSYRFRFAALARVGQTLKEAQELVRVYGLPPHLRWDRPCCDCSDPHLICAVNLQVRRRLPAIALQSQPCDARARLPLR